MTSPSASLVQSAKTAGARMADRGTPFVFNEWYAAAFSDEVSRVLLKRTLLGKRVVLFRTQDGRPVAMDDRCAHRSYPLSAGAIDGDTIVCGYHGFRYDDRGNCIQVPSAAKCPKGIGVRTYPVVERGPVVWMWMGRSDIADANSIVDLSWLTSDRWVRVKVYFHLKSSYVYLCENLMDTTHLSYMHASTIGTPDYASAPAQTEKSSGRFALIRTVSPTRLPPIWAKPAGLEGVSTAARIVRGEFMSPGVFEFTTRLYDGAVSECSRSEYRIKVAHMTTPETAGTTHYFILMARDFAHDDRDVTAFMTKGFSAAFQEDVTGLTLLDEQIGHFGHDAYEISVPSDELGVLMRRYLRQRSLDEHGIADSTADAATEARPISESS
jgi:phenylpropionate dioxygenase-like ring-hydroxylating dioxygenase large terminal subunit